MIVQIWARQVLAGNVKFEKVPRLLKDGVRKALADAGKSELAN